MRIRLVVLVQCNWGVGHLCGSIPIMTVMKRPFAVGVTVTSARHTS